MGEGGAFSFTPSGSEVGVFTFRFTATGIDGSSEETITISVTGEPEMTPLQQWLVDMGMDPDLSPEATPDASGYTVWQQYIADTDPDDDDSFPRVLDMYPNGTGWKIEVDKAGSANRRYLIYTASELNENGQWNWELHQQVTQADGQINVMPASGDLLIFKVEIDLP